LVEEADDNFFHLLPGRKRLMDTVKMISYRVEDSMAGILKDPTVDMCERRREIVRKFWHNLFQPMRFITFSDQA
jgi:hypothetical protein